MFLVDVRIYFFYLTLYDIICMSYRRLDFHNKLILNQIWTCQSSLWVVYIF